MAHNQLGALLDHYMALRGLTPYRLARLSGHSEATISRIRSGETVKASLQTLRDLASALQVPVVELLEAAGRHELAAQYRALPASLLQSTALAIPATLPIPGVDDVDSLAYHLHKGKTREFLLLNQQRYKLNQQFDDHFLDDAKFTRLPETAQDMILRLLRGIVYGMETILMTGQFLLRYSRNGQTK